MNDSPEPLVAIIGGSGFYQLNGLNGVEEIRVETPYGDPSDALMKGRLSKREVIFLPRHGRSHRLLPSEINHRANIWALRSAGVRFIISVTVVGSLRKSFAPGHVVLPNQFVDRASDQTRSTFFGEGIVGHVSNADPYCKKLRGILAESLSDTSVTVHPTGTYGNIHGPSYSTRAETKIYREMGIDILGMSNVPEVKLAREAEIAIATMAMVTDYDCWRPNEEVVSNKMVMQQVHENAEKAKQIIAQAIPRIPRVADWKEHRLLEDAMATPRYGWPEKTIEKLRPILQPYL